jgi:glycosyltransferase involved in cell wall biosynthesis
MPPARIHVYTVCWNEEVMLPFFLDHYADWCDRIFVFDNGSDDRTAEIVRAHPKCEWRDYHTGGELDERNLLRVKEQAWKEHRGEADWAVVVDVDELVHFGPLDPRAVLEGCAARGESVLRPLGFNMVLDAEASLAQRPGRRLVEEHHLGVHKKIYSKPCIFSPSRIESVSFRPGAHQGTFVPRARIYRDPRIRLFHYKYVGLECMLARYRRYVARLSAHNRERGLGYHYLEDEERIRADYARQLRRRRDVLPAAASAPVVGPLLRGAFRAATALGMDI